MRIIMLGAFTSMVISSSVAAQSGPPKTLDTMKVTANAPRALTLRNTFDERRLRGNGHFIDTVELNKRGQAKLSDLLQSETGMRVMRPPMCTNYVTDPRLKSDQHRFNCSNSAAGTVRVAVSRGFCAMKVYLNGMSMNSGGEIDAHDEQFNARHNWNTVFDLSSVELGSLEKVEVYSRSDVIPLELKGNDTECGLIMLWTRQ